MQTNATAEKSKSTPAVGMPKNKQQSFFAPVKVQPKLTIGAVDDPYEREADAMAERVMRMPDTKTEPTFFHPTPLPVTPVQRKCASCEDEEKLRRKEKEEEKEPVQLKPAKEFDLQRKCASCEDEEKQKVQMKGESSAIGGMTAPPIVHDVINSRGQPLDKGTISFMESRFGYDFSNVQIHNDSLAHQSSKKINALAYTHGNHVVFGGGQYQPGTNAGKQLLAHELTHVIQQRSPQNSTYLRRKGKADRVDFQLTNWYNDTAAKKFDSNQVAAIFFPPGKYVPDKADNLLIDLLVKNYTYTVKRHNGLKIKLVGHADSNDFSKMTNDELAFQRARWISGNLKSTFREAKVAESLITTEVIGDGITGCTSDPDCYKKHESAQMALQRRVDVIIDITPLPIPDNVDCPPKSIIKIETLSEYIDLVGCAEKLTGYDPRTMLSLLRQLYYGSSSWSLNVNSFWDAVIPCKRSFPKSPMDQFDKNVFLSLQQNQVVEGKDIGHIFTGLEAMACPQEVIVSKSKFGVGITLATNILNELFATWIGDLGSSVGQYVACFIMQGEVSDQVMKDDCKINANTIDELVKKLTLYFYFDTLSSSSDLEGDIDSFVIRVAENGIPCKNSEKQTFNLQLPVSSILRMYYFNTTPVKNDVGRFLCFADILGATLSSNKITNKAAITKKYREQVSNFAQLYYAKNVKTGVRIPSGLSLELINKSTTDILTIFWYWIESKMT